MTRTGRRFAALLAVVAVALVAAAGALAAPKGSGDWTAQDVNNAVASGLDFLMSQQDLSGTPSSNPSYGSVGTSYPITETSMLVIAFGVVDQGNPASLSAAQRASLKAALDYLLKNQDLTGPGTNTDYGSWHAGLQNYDTSLAVSALSFSGNAPTDPSLQSVATAKQKGRDWLIAHQTWHSGCDGAAVTDSSAADCGGFTYSGNPGNGADASNTGFSMTGIELSGGVPAQVAQRNLVWQRKVQEIASNPVRHGTDNDGCGSYYPGFGGGVGSEVSNANDTGTLLFGYGYDGLKSSDAGVQAGLACGNHLLGAYELSKDQRSMIRHNADTLGPPCHVNDSGCEYVTDGDGGYHYSMFSLSKGIGQFTPSSLTDPSNFYARIVDLLLSQQGTDGSWPVDPRDDATSNVSTGFSILALGRVGQPATISGVVYNDANGNGSRDEGEPGMKGVTVFADKNGNGKLDSGDPHAVSDSNGAYTISNVAPSVHYAGIREVVPSGFTCTEPSPCRYGGFTPVSGQTITGKRFGNHKSSQGGGLPPPVAGKTVNARHVSGVVIVECPGKPPHQLTGAEQIHVGCTLDTTNGAVQLFWARGNGKIEHGTFSEGAFVVTQVVDQVNGEVILWRTVLDLTGGPPQASCDPEDTDPRLVASRHHHRRTHSHSHGHVSTHSHHSAAAASATEWTMEECGDGTLTTVFEGTVKVTDFGTGKTVFVTAGHHYFARAVDPNSWR